MKYLHPFPARMAPEIMDDILADAKEGQTVLDPMCGSGTVLAKALDRGLNAIGLDLDPLAVLLSRAIVTRTNLENAQRDAEAVLKLADRRPTHYGSLPWIRRCPETIEFIEYWFAEEQADALAALAIAISRHRFSSAQSKRLCQIALSKTIITKHVGASLAWDISHSRPHKVRTENDYDVRTGFVRAANWVTKTAGERELSIAGKVLTGDARNCHRLAAGVDRIVTSPPYLNAIDYMRGHKFSLIWLGHTIPSLRSIRSTTIGAERRQTGQGAFDDEEIKNKLRRLKKLPAPHSNHLARYCRDLNGLVWSAGKAIKKRGQMTVVLGNSTLKGVYIENSEIFKFLATKAGFKLEEEYSRRIPTSKRYLPETDKHNQLDKRMRKEIVQTYVYA